MTGPGRARATAALRLIGAPLLLGLAVWWAGPQAIWAAVRGADVGWLVAGLLCSTIGNAAAALRWRELVRWLGHRVGAGWAVAVYFHGVAVNALLPGAVVGGDMLRAWQLNRRGCRMSAASVSVVLDRLSGLWILFAIAALALLGGQGSAELDALRTWAHVPASWPTVVIATVAALAVLALPLAVLFAIAAWAGHGAPPESRRATAVALLQRPQAMQQYLRQAVASAVVQAFAIGALWCAARAFGVQIPTWAVAATAAPIFLLAALPVSFGGWGTREMATVTAWTVFGVAPALAVGASAAFGAFALIQAVLGLLPLPKDAAPLSPSS